MHQVPYSFQFEEYILLEKLIVTTTVQEMCKLAKIFKILPVHAFNKQARSKSLCLHLRVSCVRHASRPWSDSNKEKDSKLYPWSTTTASSVLIMGPCGDSSSTTSSLRHVRRRLLPLVHGRSTSRGDNPPICDEALAAASVSRHLATWVTRASQPASRTADVIRFRLFYTTSRTRRDAAETIRFTATCINLKFPKYAIHAYLGWDWACNHQPTTYGDSWVLRRASGRMLTKYSHPLKPSTHTNRHSEVLYQDASRLPRSTISSMTPCLMDILYRLIRSWEAPLFGRHVSPTHYSMTDQPLQQYMGFLFVPMIKSDTQLNILRSRNGHGINLRHQTYKHTS